MLKPFLRSFARALVPFLLAASASTGGAAGVTIITHGFGGNADGWVRGMAERIAGFPGFGGTNTIRYEATVSDSGGLRVSSRKLGGGNPLTDPTAEIVITLDWGELAGLFSQYDTYEVAAAVVPSLLRTDFIAELNGRALAELPLHFIGHSRGASLACQMSRLLGTNGVWVDHITTLDPHPVNEDGNVDPLIVSDAPLRVYENVLFADNYFQEFGGYPHGQFMPGSYNRQLTALPGGYSPAHSDMHLWYHATIDFRSSANDTEASLSAADRGSWFNAYESGGSRTGYFYGRTGNGNRLSVDRPTGADYPALGFNQRWNLGGGTGPNRTALPRVSAAWPNLIRMNLAGTNQIVAAQSNVVTLFYQWAQPESAEATMTLMLDADLNPWNGNERVIEQATVNGTTSSNVFVASWPFAVSAAIPPGGYALLVRYDGGNRTRYQYAPERVTILNPPPPSLAIVPAPNVGVRVDVAGVQGSTTILEFTEDWLTWWPVATNANGAAAWSYFEEGPAGRARFFRARRE